MKMNRIEIVSFGCCCGDGSHCSGFDGPHRFDYYGGRHRSRHLPIDYVSRRWGKATGSTVVCYYCCNTTRLPCWRKMGHYFSDTLDLDHNHPEPGFFLGCCDSVPLDCGSGPNHHQTNANANVDRGIDRCIDGR